MSTRCNLCDSDDDVRECGVIMDGKTRSGRLCASCRNPVQQAFKSFPVGRVKGIQITDPRTIRPKKP